MSKGLKKARYHKWIRERKRRVAATLAAQKAAPAAGVGSVTAAMKGRKR